MNVEDKIILTKEMADSEEVLSEKEPKSYEMGYLLTPLLPEEEAGNLTLTIRGMVESRAGMIISEAVPEMRRLAYPIEKNHSGYFGWMKFIAKPSAVEEFQKVLQGEKNVIRFMIVSDNKKEKKGSGNYLGVVSKTSARPRIPEVVEKDSQPIDTAEIDRKLEELTHEETINV